YERQPFPAYALSNLGAEIRRCRQRVEQIKRQRSRRDEAERAGGVSVKVHPDHNWAVVTFAEKPERAVLGELKAAGFRWGGGCWQGRADALPERFRERA